jgi:hypothetical protein
MVGGVRARFSLPFFSFFIEPAYSILTVIAADCTELIEDGSFGIFGSSAITGSDGLKVIAF